MLIKYSDKFESLLYAIMCHNLTGHFLMPKSQPQGLFEDEEYIDIDTVNKERILADHNIKFGAIAWLKLDDKKTVEFKENISLVLRYWHSYKYKIAIDNIKMAIKLGLTYLSDSNEYKLLLNIAKQVNNEVIMAAGYVNLIPAQKDNHKFLIGEYNEESSIGDLILLKLREKYFGYGFLLRTPKAIYWQFKDNLSILGPKDFDAAISLAKILEVLYQRAADKSPEKKEAAPIFNLLAGQELAFG